METVVLLHGLGRTSRSMASIARALERDGFAVSNQTYPGYRQTIEKNAEVLATALAELDANDSVTRIHLVTHSLGGIIVRQALRFERPSKLGRVVMLAPPNRGSRIARFLSSLFGWPLILAHLSDSPASLVNSVPAPAGVAIGVIAGAYDGKVSVEKTHLDGEVDHLVVPAFHTFLMRRPDVHRQTVAFLRAGAFTR